MTAIGVAVWVSRRKRNRPFTPEEIRAIADRLMKTYGGERRSVDGVPMLFLDRAGYEAAVELNWRRGVTIHVRPKGAFTGRLRLAPENFSSVASKVVMGEDHRTGDSAFDDDWLIFSDPPGYLAEAVQRGLVGIIRTVGLYGKPLLTVSPESMLFRFQPFSTALNKRPEIFDRAVDWGMRLADFLPKLETDKVRVEEVRQTSEMADTECQVCGTALEGKVVRCTRCATLHHEDCWHFNGQCATFACGSISFESAGKG